MEMHSRALKTIVIICVFLFISTGYAEEMKCYPGLGMTTCYKNDHYSELSKSSQAMAGAYLEELKKQKANEYKDYNLVVDKDLTKQWRNIHRLIIESGISEYRNKMIEAVFSQYLKPNMTMIIGKGNDFEISVDEEALKYGLNTLGVDVPEYEWDELVENIKEPFKIEQMKILMAMFSNTSLEGRVFQESILNAVGNGEVFISRSQIFHAPFAEISGDLYIHEDTMKELSTSRELLVFAMLHEAFHLYIEERELATIYLDELFKHDLIKPIVYMQLKEKFTLKQPLGEPAIDALVMFYLNDNQKQAKYIDYIESKVGPTGRVEAGRLLIDGFNASISMDDFIQYSAEILINEYRKGHAVAINADPNNVTMTNIVKSKTREWMEKYNSASNNAVIEAIKTGVY